MEHDPRPRVGQEAVSDDAETPRPDLPGGREVAPLDLGEEDLTDSEVYDPDHFEPL